MSWAHLFSFSFPKNNSNLTTIKQPNLFLMAKLACPFFSLDGFNVSYYFLSDNYWKPVQIKLLWNQGDPSDAGYCTQWMHLNKKIKCRNLKLHHSILWSLLASILQVTLCIEVHQRYCSSALHCRSTLLYSIIDNYWSARIFF